MHKLILRLLLLACGVGALFILIFVSLQNETIYKASLGKWSSNYARTGSKRDVRIQTVQKPYVHFDNESVNHWDAALYKQVRDNAYVSGARLAKEKLAFYPLFPLLWKLSRIDSEVIVYYNYGLFILGLMILALLLIKDTGKTPLLFLVALLVPTAATYYLPYAESLFVLTMAIAVWGIMKQNYWMYCMGAVLFCLTRPSAMIFMVALLAADCIELIRHGNAKHFLTEFWKKISPCILGLGIVTLVQYLYTGSWTAYFDSMDLWPAESGMFNLITDWSLEGFGMTVFAIFFLAIPSLFYLIFLAWKSLRSMKSHPAATLFGSDTAFKMDYLFHVSLLFIAGNLAYTFLTSGNVINGFSRYTMAVPFFYIILFLLPEKIRNIPVKTKLLFFGLCLAGLCLFLQVVLYGGNRFRFVNMGLLLSLLLTLFYLFEQHLTNRTKWVILAVISIPCILWHTYLFNMFLSDAWIFT
jgi:hypothetical protein